MPTLFQKDGYRFFFYSNEGNPREPVHIHVTKGEGEAKFWIEPDILLERSRGFDARTQRRLAVMIEEHQDIILEAWNGYFS